MTNGVLQGGDRGRGAHGAGVAYHKSAGGAGESGGGGIVCGGRLNLPLATAIVQRWQGESTCWGHKTSGLSW